MPECAATGGSQGVRLNPTSKVSSSFPFFTLFFFLFFLPVELAAGVQTVAITLAGQHRVHELDEAHVMVGRLAEHPVEVAADVLVRVLELVEISGEQPLRRVPQKHLQARAETDAA